MATQKPKAREKGRVAMQRLAELGWELKRPTQDLLRDGVHELRWALNHVQYRVLFGFHGRTAVVLAHAITKEGTVPDVEINRARKRLQAFQTNPGKYTYEETEEDQ
jgi:phage-related protein